MEHSLNIVLIEPEIPQNTETLPEPAPQQEQNSTL